MVDPDPNGCRALLATRRATLKRLVYGAAAAVVAEPGTGWLGWRSDPALQTLARELTDAEAALAVASARLARAEQRLFALRPAPPQEILMAADDLAPIVPLSWSVLPRHLRCRYAGRADARACIKTARRAWEEHQVACARLRESDGLLDAEAAVAEIAVRIESLQRCIAETPASTPAGLRLKLAILWSRSGRAPEGSDHEDWDLGEALLWSALQDAENACATV